jgi:hypothetical protein
MPSGQILIGIIILAVPAAAFLIAVIVGAYLNLTVTNDMRNRVPLQFRGESFRTSIIAELIWMPGIPVKTRRRFIFAGYCSVVAFTSLALLAGLLVAGNGVSLLPIFIIFCALAIWTGVSTLSARIRHRDKLK